MTDQQLYIAVSLPMLAILMAQLMNGIWFVTLNNRVQSIETRLDGRIDRIDAKLDKIDERMNTRFDRLEASLANKLDLLTGKVIEIDNRLTRVAEQLKHR